MLSSGTQCTAMPHRVTFVYRLDALMQELSQSHCILVPASRQQQPLRVDRAPATGRVSSAIRGSALGNHVMNRAAHVCHQAFGIVASEQLPPTSPVLTPGAMQPISRCSMATMLAALGPHCWWVVLLGCAEAGRSGHACREGKLPAATSCLREMVFGRRLSALLEVLSDDGPSAGAITGRGTPGRNAFAARAQRLASGVPSHPKRAVYRANALQTARPSISACKCLIPSTSETMRHLH